MIRILALVASVEDDPTARESELFAIFETSGPGLITPSDVDPILQLAVDDLDPSEREYVQGIREDLGDLGGGLR